MRKLAFLLLLATGALARDGALTIYVSPEHPYSLSRDPAAWLPAQAEEGDYDLVLTHRSGKAAAAVIAFKEGGTLDLLREAAIERAKLAASDSKVVSERRETKDGAEILRMRTAGTVDGVPTTYIGAYWIGGGQVVQLVAQAATADLPQVQKDVESLLDGLHIRVPVDSAKKERAFTIDFPPAKWRVTDDGSRGADMMFAHASGDVVALAGATRLEVAKGGLRDHVVEKSKSIGPGGRFVSAKEKTVNGTKVTAIRVDGIDMGSSKATLYGYFYAAGGVYVEAITVTPEDRFEARKADLAEFLDGLRIHSSPE